MDAAERIHTKNTNRLLQKNSGGEALAFKRNPNEDSQEAAALKQMFHYDPNTTAKVSTIFSAPPREDPFLLSLSGSSSNEGQGSLATTPYGAAAAALALCEEYHITQEGDKGKNKEQEGTADNARAHEDSMTPQSGSGVIGGDVVSSAAAAAPFVRMRSKGHLESEDDEGNCEYKWRLTGITDDRFEHLVTQMKFRVAEGQGRCVYEIGVADDGSAVGLHDDDYEESVATVMRMAAALGYQCRVAYERTIEEGEDEDENENDHQRGEAKNAPTTDFFSTSMAAKAILMSSAASRQRKQRCGRRGRRAAARGALDAQAKHRLAQGGGEEAESSGRIKTAVPLTGAETKAFLEEATARYNNNKSNNNNEKDLSEFRSSVGAAAAAFGIISSSNADGSALVRRASSLAGGAAVRPLRRRCAEIHGHQQ